MKRLLDVCFSSFSLLIVVPLLIVIALIVAVRLGCPVFFYQTRPGLNGKPFRIVKFRTMTNARDESGSQLSDDVRLTPFGRFLRSSSLDELPELWNVLKGEMSLVGPRPLLMEYLPLYSLEQVRRHEVRPGITGWAQVNGRNAVGWDDRFKMDVWYVDNWSLWLDFKIVLLTVLKLLKRDGINAEGHATMPMFTKRHGETQSE